jgi:hypothetical protein
MISDVTTSLVALCLANAGYAHTNTDAQISAQVFDLIGAYPKRLAFTTPALAATRAGSAWDQQGKYLLRHLEITSKVRVSSPH